MTVTEMISNVATAGRGRLAEVIASRGGEAAPEARFVIEHREALIYMLCEAAPTEPPADATNFLGGVGDVLEAKARRGVLDHLGDLATVASTRMIDRSERSATDGAASLTRGIPCACGGSESLGLARSLAAPNATVPFRRLPQRVRRS